MKISDNVLTFASGNMKLFEQFQDYWNHYKATQLGKPAEYDTNLTFAEKEDKMSAAIRKEIIRRSGVTYATESNVAEWFNHPMVQHEAFAVIGALVDMILPESIIDSIGLYTDVRQGGFGDSFAFDVETRDLFVVSKSGHAQRHSEVHKQFKGQVVVLPEFHQLTVGVSMYKVLSGTESLAVLASKIIRSIETQMTIDAYTAFADSMAAVDDTASVGLRIAGYTQASLVGLAQRVSAWNGGAKPVIVGTQLALVNVLPDDSNYRYTLDDDFMKLGYVKTAFGYDVMVLPQVANLSTPFAANVISDSYLWIISPSSQKLFKLCLEGTTLSYTNQPFDNANLAQLTTMTKSWGIGLATSSVAGVITL